MNSMTLHTANDCQLNSTASKSKFSGSISNENCYAYAAGEKGCGFSAPESFNSYGPRFNENQGGVYATEWTSDGISIWFFPRNEIPSDINCNSSTVDTSSWPSPVARFDGDDCDWASHFKDLNIVSVPSKVLHDIVLISHQQVFDITFCGDWAGQVWSQSSTCTSKASSCQDYVANHAADFKDTYWSINSLRVYSTC